MRDPFNRGAAEISPGLAEKMPLWNKTLGGTSQVERRVEAPFAQLDTRLRSGGFEAAFS